MRKLTSKESKELLEFFLELDFKKIDDNTVEIVSNRFCLDDLPAFIKYQIELYLEALEIIN
jgi:hypothetical protein